VEDEEVGEERALPFRNQPEEVLLYLLRVVLFREAESARDTPDVSVHDDALVDAESVAQDHVGRLTADAGEGD
jgi:hypothetical protein